MVADLMCNDVGVGEVTVRAQLAFHRAEETQVDVQAFVRRAVERSHGGAAGAAAGLRRAGIQDHGRVPVGSQTLGLEISGPDIFGSGEDLLGEAGQFLFFLGEFHISLLGRSSHAELAGIDLLAGQQVNDTCEEKTSDAKATGDGTAASAAIFYIRAFTSSV